MQSRQEPAAKHKNRATGFSDADWGALEKRLSDTRDLLQDILLHLRRVLDNLKTVGDSCQSAGRAWRRTDSAAGPGRAQTTRARSATGSGGDPRKAPGGAKSYASFGATGARGAAGASDTSGASGAAGARFQSAGAKASGASGATGAAGRQTHFGASGAHAAGSANDQTFTGTSGRPGATGAAGARASQDRQAGNGFSWSSRTRTDSASSSSSNFTGGAQQKASSRDWRAQREARSENTSGDRADSRAGNRESFGSQSRQERPGGQTGSKAGQQGHKQGHRTTGAGGGSSYQEYRQRTHKSPLGSGRMTLTQACALLCIAYPCTADDIKSAYRKQARRHHPDLGGNEEMMKSINQAYELALSWCAPLRGKSATWAA